MTICKGFAPPPPGRKQAHAQRCGAVPAKGRDYCAVHERLFGCCKHCGAPQHTCYSYKAGASKCCQDCEHLPLMTRPGR